MRNLGLGLGFEVWLKRVDPCMRGYGFGWRRMRWASCRAISGYALSSFSFSLFLASLDLSDTKVDEP